MSRIRTDEALAGRKTEFLFRGITDSTFPLATTLERAGWDGTPIYEYYRVVDRAKSEIETFTNEKWELPDWPEVQKELCVYDTWSLRRFPDRATHSYMVRLRHHGFPSPLLDWSRSLYIAAYFAFRSATKPKQGKVSVYMFSEQPTNFKSSGGGHPQIRRIGPYVTTHRRHFLQQSDYTMCATFNSEWCFAKHSDIFNLDGKDQDVLWKIDIPWKERSKVLKTLDTYTLNAFSLFGSEESLMEKIALREFGT